MSQSQAIAVLGMHRSGTSALTGTLKEAGLYLGEVLDTGFSLNRKGLQEAPSILFMQENLLQENGGSWHQPPGAVVWGRLHESVRDLFIESRAHVPVWGFKDPRTLLTLEGWLKVLPELKCAGIFRHPAEVAASLNKRNGFDTQKGIFLWEAYNRRLLDYCERMDFPVVEFTGDDAAMQSSFSRLIGKLDLTPGTQADFYESRLRVHERPDLPVPRSSQDIFERLRERAL